ncbi:riboflavin synthase, partial [Pseudomonas stutzeri]|nr:riboflavin synthase [Stutzerimonas stutzeri]
VDGKAEIVNKQVIDNTILLSFKPKESILMREIVAKGSVAISGVSLTVIEKTSQTFQIGLIPHTQLQTTLSKLTVGHWVNIETDILAKYMTGGQYVG